MGVFGTGPFENDAALDWLIDVGQRGDVAVRLSLDQVTKSKKRSLSSHVASLGIAAAKLVAISIDNSGQKSFAKLFKLSGLNPDLYETLNCCEFAELALSACRKVREPSCELYLEWLDSGLEQQWIDVVLEIERVLERLEAKRGKAAVRKMK